jgi:P-type conjugative transfer protein TrbJ
LKRTISLAAAVLLAALAPRPASAQTVYCTNCGSEYTQLANYAQLADQLIKQAGILQQSINQYQNMVRNSTPLTQQQWGGAMNDIRAVNSILSQAQSLTYLAGGLDAAFAKKFNDYNGYVNGSIGAQTFAAKYQQWSADTSSSVLTTLKAAGSQSSQITGAEDQLLQILQSQAETAGGTMQALQVGNEVSVQTVRQLQKLRQLVLADLQLKANFIQTHADKEAVQQAAWKQFVKPPPGY